MNWLRRIVLAVVTIFVAVTLPSPGAALAHVYDAPAVAPGDVHELGAVRATQPQLIDQQKKSGSPLSSAQGTSTTPLRSLIATNTASLADEGFISPSSIRFSQSSVSPNFSAGGSIDDLTAGLRNGSVAPGDVPQIRIFESNGQWMTLDNRRLVAFQQAGVDVPYRLA